MIQRDEGLVWKCDGIVCHRYLVEIAVTVQISYGYADGL